MRYGVLDLGGFGVEGVDGEGFEGEGEAGGVDGVGGRRGVGHDGEVVNVVKYGGLVVSWV